MKAAISAIFLCLLTNWVAATEMYKCDDGTGRLVFSDKPCGATAQKITVQVPQQSTGSQSEGEAIRLKLLYNSQPLTTVTKTTPRFWLRSEADRSKEITKFDVRYNEKDQTFSLGGIPDGQYGANITVDANAANPDGYPGDYYAWKTFGTIKGLGAATVVHMLKVIHLLQPQDSNFPLPEWGNACDKQIIFKSPLTIRWESLGPDIRYSYEVRRIVCNPWRGQEVVASDGTMDTHAVLKLPVNKAGESYLLTLTAQGTSGRPVGGLIVHGQNGHGWDYRFRITE